MTKEIGLFDFRTGNITENLASEKLPEGVARPETGRFNECFEHEVWFLCSRQYTKIWASAEGFVASLRDEPSLERSDLLARNRRGRAGCVPPRHFEDLTLRFSHLLALDDDAEHVLVPLQA